MKVIGTPLCYECEKLISLPQAIGKSAVCSEYSEGIPKEILFYCGKCDKICKEISNTEA